MGDSHASPHFRDYAELACDIADLARRWLSIGIQNGGLEARSNLNVPATPDKNNKIPRRQASPPVS